MKKGDQKQKDKGGGRDRKEKVWSLNNMRKRERALKKCKRRNSEKNNSRKRPPI